jgi:hypothetical protein
MQRALLWANDICDVRIAASESSSLQNKCAYKRNTRPISIENVRIYWNQTYRIKIRIAGA